MANKEIVGWFTRGGKRVPIFKGEGSGNKSASKTLKSSGNSSDSSANKHEAYNKKVIEKHAKDIEKHGSASISFEEYSGTNKEFIKAAEKAGYHARYDKDGDRVVVSKSEKNDTLKNARYKRRNGNKIYY